MNKSKHALSTLIGVIIVAFFVSGGLSAIAVFMPTLLQETGYSATALYFVFTFITIVGFLIGLVYDKMQKKFNAKKWMLIGIVCNAIGYLICAAGNTSIVVIYIGMCLVGVSTVLAGHTGLSVIITNWYTTMRAKMIGIAFAALAFGGTVMSPIAGRLIAAFGWQGGFVGLAVIVFVISFLSCMFLVKNDPASCGEEPQGAGEDAPATVKSEMLDGCDAAVAKKSAAFYIAILGVALSGIIMNCISSVGPTFLVSVGLDSVAASDWAGINTAFGAVGVLIGGWAVDKWGFKPFFIYSAICAIVGVFLYVTFGTAGNFSMLWFAFVFLGLGYPVGSATAPNLTVAAFGRKDYNKIIGFIMAGYQLRIAVSSPIFGAIQDATGSAAPCFYFAMVCCILSFICVFVSLAITPWKPAKKA